MPDLLDVVAEQTARALEANIAAARAKETTIKTQANGLCLYCSEQLAPAERFCDKDCADDYQKYILKN